MISALAISVATVIPTREAGFGWLPNTGTELARIRRRFAGRRGELVTAGHLATGVRSLCREKFANENDVE